MTSTEVGRPAQKRSSRTQVIPHPDPSVKPRLPAGSRAQRAAVVLHCVWTDHLHGDRRCDESIPAEAVLEAWRVQKEESNMSEGFFRFSWGGGTWLGYGLPDGRVRGTYCPTHTAERDARAQRPTPSATADGAPSELAARRARPLSLVK
jgi:hypothetical protein